jgi:hypothetical protein
MRHGALEMAQPIEVRKEMLASVLQESGAGLVLPNARYQKAQALIAASKSAARGASAPGSHAPRSGALCKAASEPWGAWTRLMGLSGAFGHQPPIPLRPMALRHSKTPLPRRGFVFHRSCFWL